MEKYIIFRQKAFENTNKFEKRLNEKCMQGYSAINMTHTGGLLAVLLQRNKL